MSAVSLRPYVPADAKRCAEIFRVRDGHTRSIGGETLRDGCANPPGTAGN